MNAELKAALQAQIERIRQSRSELNKLQGRDDYDVLNAGATPAQIEQVQALASFVLPPDYLAFLVMHNGWQGFSGENDLLSSDQMASGPMLASVNETKALQREDGDPAADGFVINASISGSDIAFIDPATVRADGTADVVRWDPRMGEYKRFPSFLAYLSAQADLLQVRIAKEREKLR